MVPDGQNHYFIRILGLLVISARKLIHVQSSFNILEPLDTCTHDQAIPFTNRSVDASLVIKHFGVGAIKVHHRLYWRFLRISLWIRCGSIRQYLSVANRLLIYRFSQGSQRDANKAVSAEQFPGPVGDPSRRRSNRIFDCIRFFRHQEQDFDDRWLGPGNRSCHGRSCRHYI